MKKFLFFLAMIITINVSAQSTTWFGKPLELDNVPASTSKSDSILVRGVDKIIKWIPRSEFGDISIQGIMDQLPEKEGRGTLISDNGASSITLDMQATDSGSSIGLSSKFRDDTFTLGTASGKLNMVRTHFDGEWELPTYLDFELPVGTTTLLFPAKINDGTYTLATLDDIPEIVPQVIPSLNEVTSVGNESYQDLIVATQGDHANQTTIQKWGVLVDWYGARSAELLHDKLTFTEQSTSSKFSEYNAQFIKLKREKRNTVKIIPPYEQGDIEHQLFLPNESGTVALVEKTLPKAPATGYYLIFGADPTGETFYYSFPISSGDSVWGTDPDSTSIINRPFEKTEMTTSSTSIPSSAAVINYLDSRTVEEFSSTALTSAYLDTAYPTVTKGFRVIAASLSSGGLIYEKTSQGWISTEILSVP